MAQPHQGLAPLEMAGWKSALSWTAALLLAVLFLASGIWKITDAPSAAMRMTQALVPESLSLWTALGVGVLETLSGVFILVPRFRRWGATLIGVLLLAFLVYFAINYNALRGADCSCFPWLKRVVGPGFFIGDGLMLLMALAAGIWTKPSEGLRSAVLVLSAVLVFAMVSYGMDVARQTGAKAPASITADGKPYSLQSGKILLFLFDPRCSHCSDAAAKMSKLAWDDARIVAIPVDVEQFAPAFLKRTGLQAALSNDLEAIKKAFGYNGYPSAIALQNGRQKALLTKFEEEEPNATLKKLGFIR